jgi:hypothetical protein
MKIKFELEKVEEGNIHKIIRKRYNNKGKLKDKKSVGYIESRFANLISFDEMEY